MQKFTIRPVLWNYQKNKEKIYSIKIAITVDRKVTYLLTGYKVHESQWDEANKAVYKHTNAKIINVSLRRKIAEIEKDLIENSLKGLALSKRVIKGDTTTYKNFYEYAKEVRYDDTEINRIKAYAGDRLMLNDINVQFLRKFEQHERSRGLMQNTLNSTFKYIGRIIRQAHKESLLSENPFDHYDIPRYKQTDRVYLTEDEIKRIIDKLDELPPTLYNTATWFLLGCYSGLRNGDWRVFDYDKMVEGDYIKLRASKNGVHVVLPIGKTLRKILDRVKDLPRCYTNEECNRNLKVIAMQAKIKKNLTTHCARHTFGYMCASNGLPESTTAALIGVTANVVKVYYHLSGENIKLQAEILKYL